MERVEAPTLIGPVPADGFPRPPRPYLAKYTSREEVHFHRPVLTHPSSVQQVRVLAQRCGAASCSFPLSLSLGKLIFPLPRPECIPPNRFLLPPGLAQAVGLRPFAQYYVLSFINVSCLSFINVQGTYTAAVLSSSSRGRSPAIPKTSPGVRRVKSPRAPRPGPFHPHFRPAACQTLTPPLPHSSPASVSFLPGLPVLSKQLKGCFSATQQFPEAAIPTGRRRRRGRFATFAHRREGRSFRRWARHAAANRRKGAAKQKSPNIKDDSRGMSRPPPPGYDDVYG